MKCILGRKVGMTQVFRDNGSVVPVTRVQAGPCVVTQVRTKEKDGVNAIQIGFGSQKAFRLSQATAGHLKGLTTVRFMRDAKTEQQLSRGDMFTVSTFAPGDTVQVVGNSKGRGFQGVVKRHGFAGSLASHGHKDQLRMPGSIGAGGVQRTFKGIRMGGHMGTQQVTIKNLEIVAVDTEKNELLIKGAVPGARNGLLMISSESGEILVETTEVAETKEEVVQDAEETTAEVTATEDVVAPEVVVEPANEETVVEEITPEPVAEEVAAVETPAESVEEKA